jgi:hypothetical protein
MFIHNQFQKVVEEIFFKYSFELPFTWIMMGVNGAIFAGSWYLSIVDNEFKTLIVSGRPEDLRFPINMMVMDKNWRIAHILFEKPDGPIDLTNFQVGQA